MKEEKERAGSAVPPGLTRSSVGGSLVGLLSSLTDCRDRSGRSGSNH